MVPCLFITGLIESPDKLLEYVAHFNIGNLIGMEVNIAKLRDNEKKPVGLIQLSDMLLKAKMFEMSRARLENFLMYCVRFAAILFGSP